MKRPVSPSVHRFLRRRLLGAAAFAGVGGALTACDSTARAADGGNCVPTERDALGPFYVENTPVLTSLNRWNRAGEPMIVTGRVLAADDESPVAGARLEVWQTDGDGRYHPQGNGPAEMYEDREIDMRGTVVAGDDGAYTYDTLVPAPYWPRPRHIHYRVSAPGFRTLVTQHYLSDGEPVPGGPCRSGSIERAGEVARFDGPVIYLSRV